jgi:hypothetical protein
MIKVFEAVRQAAPQTWFEATCFKWNPSPWWLFYCNSVIGCYGSDSPSGRVPAPVYRESYTSARDYFNLQGAAYTTLPICAQEVLGIIHQSPDPFMNDAVMSLLRGHMFQSAYVNPEYMSEKRWKQFADLIKWFRRNDDILSMTQPLLPKSWFGGNVPQYSSKESMPREPYGYIHTKNNVSLLALRNPWIKPQTYELKLDAIVDGKSPAKSIHAVSLYPEVRLYGKNLRADQTLRISLAPYETIVLSISPDQPIKGLKPADQIIGGRIKVSGVKKSVPKLLYKDSDNQEKSKPAIQIKLEADVSIKAPQADLLILLEGSQPMSDPQKCQLLVAGKDMRVIAINSKDGKKASRKPVPEHWLFVRAPLTQKKQTIQLELVTNADTSSISAWIWAKAPGQRNTMSYPNALPGPETISLDGATLMEPFDTSILFDSGTPKNGNKK